MLKPCEGRYRYIAQVEFREFTHLVGADDLPMTRRRAEGAPHTLRQGRIVHDAIRRIRCRRLGLHEDLVRLGGGRRVSVPVSCLRFQSLIDRPHSCPRIPSTGLGAIVRHAS